MKTNTLSAAAIGAVALLIGGAALASEHDGRMRDAQRKADQAWRTAPNAATPDDAAYGWRYLTTAGARAIVISPAGIYYLNRGDGRLVRVVPATPAAPVAAAT